MSLVISSLSLEYIRVQVSVTRLGVASDPTGDTVQFSFPTRGTDPSVWVAGSWESVTDPVTGNVTYYARCLVGPSGDAPLAAGKYNIWLKVTDSPEIPVLLAGDLLVK